METLLLLLFGMVLVVSFFNSYINDRREIAFNRIDMIYDRMELFVIQNNMLVNREMSNFLKSHKAFRVNNEYADIHILLLIRTKISNEAFEKAKASYDLFYKSLPEGLKQLSQEFDKEVNRAIAFSMFRFEFLGVFIYLVLKNTVKSILNRSFNALGNFFKSLKDLFQYENVVVCNTQGLGFAR